MHCARNTTALTSGNSALSDLSGSCYGLHRCSRNYRPGLLGASAVLFHVHPSISRDCRFGGSR
ncbi:hypothetical protein B0T21DRAFT_355203 [Apiosordaria backusii]|uniref:Uncharacterized protein n=1 Tax=Apiosordaria backusii TaxID=314023 RepID=A0AA40K6J4_9PEZI|nr:hypothetical protein B0T21DRAFT_355203 [Apiosordaria backusii]